MNIYEVSETKTGEFVYGVDFQETSQGYRDMFIERLMFRHPQPEFKHTWRKEWSV